MKKTIIAAFAAATAFFAAAEEIKPVKNLRTCVIQPAYAFKYEDIAKVVEWEIAELEKCGEDLDLIVLPEASDRQGKVSSPEQVKDAFKKHNAKLLDACSRTAKRCKAIVFVNALGDTPTGYRNSTFAYDRTGKLVDRYDKEHLVRSEHAKLKLDATYMCKTGIKYTDAPSRYEAVAVGTRDSVTPAF